MSCVRIQTDATERIQCTALNAATNPLTGLTDLLIAIQRVSDGFWYDFNDDTFKSTGWTTRQTAMTEVSATLAPGEYYYDFDTSAIVSPTANDTYMIYVEQSPGNTVKNTPITGEVKVGQYVDNLDQKLSTTESNIRGADSDDLKDLSDQIDALPSANDVADQVWDEAAGDHTGGGSFGEEVQSHATPTEVKTQADQALIDYDPPTKAELDTAESNIRGADGDNLKDISDQIDALPTPPTVNAIADQVWDELKAGHSGAGSFGEEVQTHATPTEVKTQADQSLIDYDPPTKAELDTVESNVRGADSDDLKTISDQIDALPTPPTANAIADQVWDEPAGDHIGVGSFGEEVQNHATPTEVKTQADQALTDYDPPTKAELDTTESNIRGTDGDDLKDISDQIDALPSASDIDTQLSGTHGAGSWEGGGSPSDIADAVWDEPKAGHTAPGSFGEEVQSHATPTEVNSEVDQGLLDYDVAKVSDVQNSEAAIRGADSDDLKAISDQIDSVPTVGEIDSQLSGSHGSGSWEGGDAAGAIADAVWDEDKSAHLNPGSFGEEVQGHATPSEVKTQADQALSDYGTAKTSDVTTAETNIRGSDNDDLKDISDQLDGVATTANAIDTRLPANPGNETTLQASHTATQAAVAGVQTDVDSIKDTVEKRTTLKQNIGYNPATNTLTANVWVERLNGIQAAPSDLTFTFYDEDGTQIFQEVVASPDGNGFFKVSKVQALTKNTTYYVTSELTLGGETVSSGKGAFTVG